LSVPASDCVFNFNGLTIGDDGIVLNCVVRREILVSNAYGRNERTSEILFVIWDILAVYWRWQIRHHVLRDCSVNALIVIISSKRYCCVLMAIDDSGGGNGSTRIVLVIYNV
jgi:hypothetical protein